MENDDFSSRECAIDFFFKFSRGQKNFFPMKIRSKTSKFLPTKRFNFSIKNECEISRNVKIFSTNFPNRNNFSANKLIRQRISGFKL